MNPAAAPGRPAAVVALKPFGEAKSRLDGLPPPLRQRLAWCLALDTLAALVEVVQRVAVVGDQPALSSQLRVLGPAVVVVPERRPGGINAALAEGAAAMVADGADTVLASVGDLPCLRAASIRRILFAAQSRPRSFVADTSGIGTTMLIAHEAELEPHFQGRSAAAHRASGAIALEEDAVGHVPDARRDVDTGDDLANAYELGLGRATAALFDETGRLGRYLPVTVTAERSHGAYTVITSEGYRALLEPAAVGTALRHLRLGQRLHAAVADDRVLSAWL